MKINLAAIPVATIIVIIAAIAGAVVVVAHPETLSFDQYLKALGPAVGLLAVGRGLDSTHKP